MIRFDCLSEKLERLFQGCNLEIARSSLVVFRQEEVGFESEPNNVETKLSSIQLT